MAARTRRQRLEDARDRAEKAMGQVDPDKLAPLLREYRAVLAELDSLPEQAEVSDADEIAARRAARRAGAARPSRAARPR
jgi:hypothetical protein